MSITSRINEMSSHIEQAYDELQGLGADLTNVNKNIENISSVLDTIYDSMPQVSGEGTSLTLDDTRVGKIKSTLKGNTSQSGTPTPTSPIPVNVVSGDNEIQVCGKNLLNIANWVKGRINNTTGNIEYASNVSSMTIEENDIKFIVSQAWNSGIASDFIPISTGTYTFTFSHNREISVYIDTYKNQNERLSRVVSYTDSASPTTRTFTISDSNVKYIRIHFEVNTANVEYIVSDMQLEKGTTPTDFEPYQGNTYNIDLPVENLFDDSTLNNKWVAQNGTITSATGANCIKYNCNANDTYTLSATFGTSSANNIIVMAFYNSSDILLNRYVTTTNTSLTMTYTAPANTSYMYAGHYGIVPTTIQLEKGSKQNNFTPYGTTPIELCKIGNYQDYFYKDSGKWYLHKEIRKVVLNGSESGWSQYANANNLVYFGISLLPNKANGNNILANYFSKTTNIWGKTSYENGIQISGNNQDCLFITTDHLTIASFKTWLSANNVKTYYVLATPTTEELTYEPLITQLNLLEKAMSKDRQTNISQVNNDLPFIISASALKEWQESTSLNSTLSMVNSLSLGNTLNTQDNNTQPIESDIQPLEINEEVEPIEVDNIEPLEEEENEES